jgi:hypothetical protein
MDGLLGQTGPFRVRFQGGEVVTDREQTGGTISRIRPGRGMSVDRDGGPG